VMDDESGEFVTADLFENLKTVVVEKFTIP